MFKKNIFISISLFLLVMIPNMTIANSFNLRSTSKTIEPNKTFVLAVYVNPPNLSNAYTVQANINFPSDLISAESFTYASAWLPMNQAGYDLIDNSTGKLIKTAGYPNGFNKETLLGTVIFKVKKAGAVSISINKESFILDMDSNNVLNNYGSFSIVSASYVAPVNVITPPTSTEIAPINPVVKPAITNTKTTTTVTKPTTREQTQSGTKIINPLPTTEKEKSLLANTDTTSKEVTPSLLPDLPKDIIENVTEVLNILPKSNATVTETINNEGTKILEPVLTTEEIIKEEKAKEDILKLVYQDTNKDGISDYDSKYIYNIDPVKASPISTYEGRSVTAGEKILLGFNPNKEELEKVAVEEPTKNIKEDIVVHSYKVIDVNLTEKKKVVFKGQALPNSYATLYIYSTPIMITIKTDSNGEWEYTMDKELEDGDHTVYVATVNNTGNIIAKSTAYPFVKTAEAVSLQEVVPTKIVEASEIEKPGFLQTKNIFFMIIGILVLIGITFILIGFFSKKKNPEVV